MKIYEVAEINAMGVLARVHRQGSGQNIMAAVLDWGIKLN